MFCRLLIALIVLISSSEAEAKGALAIPALQFGNTFGDYVKFYPDMSKVKNGLTVCAWVRKQLTGGRRSWITYRTHTHKYEILISDSGYYNWIHNDNLSVQSYVTVPLNTWTLQCNSWTTSSGTMKVYYNGILIGSKGISSAPLEEGGYILLGHDAGSQDNGEQFGGQLMNLNLFGRELSGVEITKLYQTGRCSRETEKKLEDVRFITWETILSQSKTGNVTEIDSGCPAPEEETEEPTDVPEKECDCKDQPHSIWDVLFDETYLNQTLTDGKLAELKSIWTVLGNTKICLTQVTMSRYHQDNYSISISEKH